jgi:hypothetical protein
MDRAESFASIPMTDEGRRWPWLGARLGVF